MVTVKSHDKQTDNDIMTTVQKRKIYLNLVLEQCKKMQNKFFNCFKNKSETNFFIFTVVTVK